MARETRRCPAAFEYVAVPQIGAELLAANPGVREAMKWMQKFPLPKPKGR